MKLIRNSLYAACFSLAMATAAPAFSADSVMVGGAEMYANKNIVENAVNSNDHTTLVAAVQAADLVGTLSSDGPFTVFAPTNDAFGALPEGTVETLVMPENKDTLTGILTYHVLAGTYTAADLVAAASANNGSATMATVQGGSLTMTLNGDMLTIVDANDNVANVTIADVMQSNGVIHVIDTVLLPQ